VRRPFPRVVVILDVRLVLPRAALVAAALAMAGCGAPDGTPRITPGTTAHPRPVVIVAKDYTFVPAVVDLVPGETVVLQVVNGGLVVHEAVIGDATVQAQWERGEAALSDAPPGSTPLASLATDSGGVRVVVTSGQRTDAVWAVPRDATTRAWSVGCHIPGHLAEGMIVPVRFVGPDGLPLATGFGSGSSATAEPSSP
jgi:uncharacterized cupredoxin-like copper-binding protein